MNIPIYGTAARKESLKVSPHSTTECCVIAYVGNNSEAAEVSVNVNSKPNVKMKKDCEALRLGGKFITLSRAEIYKLSNDAIRLDIAVRPSESKTYNVTGHVINVLMKDEK